MTPLQDLARRDGSGSGSAPVPWLTPNTLFWIWAALLLVLQVQGLGLSALFDVDEGAFSEATREMLASGDWGHTTLNGEPRFDKPIFIYWLQAASVGIFGLSEMALRLPSALASWGWAVAVAHFAWPRWGLRVGLAAGSVLATCTGAVLIGRAATADAMLNLWLGLAALDLWRAIEPSLKPRLQVVGTPTQAIAVNVTALRRAAAWIGLGLLTKGPVAVLVPGATLLIWLALRGWDESPRGGVVARLSGAAASGWRRLKPLLADPLAWALLLGIAVPWYAYALNRHGMAFVDGFILRHNLQRYGGSLEGHSGSAFYYVVLLPVLLFPWSALLMPLLARWRAAWAQPLLRYLVIWAAFVLVFFSGSGTKLPHYLLYGFTPLALLCGRVLAGSGEHAASTPLGRVARHLLSAALVLGPLLAIGATEWVRQRVLSPQGLGVASMQSHYRALIGAAESTAPLWWMAGAAALLAVLLNAPWLWAARPVTWALGAVLPAPASQVSNPTRHDFARAALAAALGVLFISHALVPWWAARLQSPVRDLALQARALPGRATVVQWGLHQPSFAVYYGLPCPRRAPVAGELALVRADQVEKLAASATPTATPPAPNAAPRWERVSSQPGLLLIRWLSADPP